MLLELSQIFRLCSHPHSDNLGSSALENETLPMVLDTVTWRSSGRQSWNHSSAPGRTVASSFSNESTFIWQSEAGGLNFLMWREEPSSCLASTLHEAACTHTKTHKKMNTHTQTRRMTQRPGRTHITWIFSCNCDSSASCRSPGLFCRTRVSLFPDVPGF